MEIRTPDLQPCEGGALPAELYTHKTIFIYFKFGWDGAEIFIATTSFFIRKHQATSRKPASTYFKHKRKEQNFLCAWFRIPKNSKPSTQLLSNLK